jgi:hypothetical protein
MGATRRHICELPVFSVGAVRYQSAVGGILSKCDGNTGSRKSKFESRCAGSSVVKGQFVIKTYDHHEIYLLSHRPL